MPLWLREVLVGALILAASLVAAGAATFFIRWARRKVLVREEKTV